MVRKTERGFTLLETLAAFSILAVALGIFYITFSGSMRHQANFDEDLRALTLAENNLAQVGNSIPLGLSVKEGQKGVFFWEIKITPQPAEDSKLWLYEVSSKVFWQSGKREVSLETLKLGPEVDLEEE